jgi:hypothetical protein
LGNIFAKSASKRLKIGSKNDSESLIVFSLSLFI